MIDILLGFLTSAGGFIDISNVVFNPASAARFSYTLLWPIVIGVLGAALYSEMCGRIAIVAKLAVFDIIRDRTGFFVARLTLVASVLLNILTCAAEVGGVAILLKLMFGSSYQLMLFIAFLVLLASTFFMSFKMIEWVYGIVGLLVAIFIFSAFSLHPHIPELFMGFVPHVNNLSKPQPFLFLYYIVGIIASTMMPYEIYFYSSGAMEDKWKEKDIPTNRITSYLGYGLGGLFAIAISVGAASLFFPRSISPNLVDTTLLIPSFTFGKAGFLIACVGLLFAFAGTAVETALSGAYSITQFLNAGWGKEEKPSRKPLFTACWIGIFILSFIPLLFGADPVKLTEYAVIFSAVAFPSTYFPVLIVANNKKIMGKYVNNKLGKYLGWAFLALIVVVAVTAIPLMILIHGGAGI